MCSWRVFLSTELKIGLGRATPVSWVHDFVMNKAGARLQTMASNPTHWSSRLTIAYEWSNIQCINMYNALMLKNNLSDLGIAAIGGSQKDTDESQVLDQIFKSPCTICTPFPIVMHCCFWLNHLILYVYHLYHYSTVSISYCLHEAFAGSLIS